jgi:predicted O-methyltransferase YrrM
MTSSLDAAQAIPGWMDHRELAWLAAAASTARTIIEVGCFQGRSTRALADHTTGVVHAIDPWAFYRNDDDSQADWITKDYDWPGLRRAFEAHLADHLASGRVVIHAAPSSAALPALLKTLGRRSVDLVFIDGDHRYEAVREDMALAHPLVRAGGILAGHDYGKRDWPGVKQAVDERFPQGVHSLRSIWWTRV